MAHREEISNAIENIAFRLAEKGSGTVAPAELLRYLPVSIECIIDVLNDAGAESASITAETENGIRRYRYLPDANAAALQPTTSCAVCDAHMPHAHDNLLCTNCFDTVQNALRAEAESNGWPAQAVYQHEICYLASRAHKAISAEKLASSSRYTLRRMRKFLSEMKGTLAVSEHRNSETGALLYTFAPITYPREHYQYNIQWIRSLPATVAAEVETRVIHILIALGSLFLILLLLAFLHMPYPLLFIAFLFAAPILAIGIWNHRSRIDSMEIN